MSSVDRLQALANTWWLAPLRCRREQSLQTARSCRGQPVTPGALLALAPGSTHDPGAADVRARSLSCQGRLATLAPRAAEHSFSCQGRLATLAPLHTSAALMITSQSGRPTAEHPEPELHPPAVTQHATHVRRDVLHTHVVCARARCAAEADRQSPDRRALLRLQRHGSPGLHVPLHDAVCLTIQFNAVAGVRTPGSLPACLHLALRSVRAKLAGTVIAMWHAPGPSPQCLRICQGCGNARRWHYHRSPGSPRYHGVP